MAMTGGPGVSRLASLAHTGGPAFVALFTVDALARSILVTVVAFEALELLGDAQNVSLLYFAVSGAGLAGSFALPWLIRRLGRSATLGLACLAIVLAAGLYSSHTLAGVAFGLMLSFLASSTTGICLNLCVLDHIPPNKFLRFEPMRTLFTAIAWSIGPALGIYLGNWVSELLPFVISATLGLALFAYFRFLGETEKPVRNLSATLNPLRFVRRYAAQPRLVLAWMLITGRECWWVTFFIYTPILAVTQGLSEETGGLIVSAGLGMLVLVPLWGWVGRRHGVRRLLMMGCLASGTLTMAVAAFAEVPWLMAALLIAAALGTGAAEGSGNLPFLRAVRQRERAEMLTVYWTNRGVSSIATPAAYALLLQIFALPSVFFAGGLLMASMAGLARYLPHRLGMDSRERRRQRKMA